MKTYLIIGILVLTAFSCGKDKIENRPRLTLNSVSSTTVPNGFDLQVKMRLTDKQGDFYDTIWVRKITTRCPSSNFADSLLYRVPNDLPRTNNNLYKSSLIFCDFIKSAFWLAKWLVHVFLT